MRYSVATTTALLASSTLSLALPTASSLFNLQDSSLSIPAAAHKVFNGLEGWFGKNTDVNVHDTLKGMQVTKLTQGGVDYDVLTHPDHPSYRLRVTTNSDLVPEGTRMPHLCDDSVKTISGYLDINENKHLFFWFFESRDKPAEDPLVLWSVMCPVHPSQLRTLTSCSIQAERRPRLFIHHRAYLRARPVFHHRLHPSR